MSWGFRRGQAGAAPVEFVLSMLVLLPIFFGIYQIGLTILVRNTLAACASDAARVGAVHDRGGADAADAARTCIDNSPGARWVTKVSTPAVGGMIVVDIDAKVPPLGLVGPGFGVHVSGHAVAEP